MANYSSLKNALAQVIKPNDNQEITGQIMQDALMAMINALGAGYQFVGVPTAQTDPSTPDQNVFYIAGAGTYPNFGGTVVPRGSLGVFRYNGEWNYTVLDVASWADASNKLYYNTQAGNVAAKTIQADGFTLQPGGWIKIHFDNANEAATPTLNVNNTGAHAMTFNGALVSETNSWKTGETVAFYYDNYGVGIWRGIRLVEYPDFINVNDLVGQSTPFASASAARSAIPQQNRKPGLNITYLLSTGENTSQWVQDMFIGDDVTDWSVADNWKTVGPVSVSQNTVSIGGVDVGELAGNTIENDEFLKVITDKNGCILIGIRKNGDIYYGVGMPSVIRDFITNHINELLLLIQSLDSEIDEKAGIWDEQSEFIKVVTDRNNLILYGVRPDGTVYIPLLDNPTLKALKPLETSMFLVDYFSEQADNIEWYNVTTDGKGRILEGRRRDGIKVENIGLLTNKLYLTESGLTDFEQALKKHGFTGGAGDFSDKNSMYIPEPRLAHLNIITDFDLTTLTKTSDVPVTLEFYDGAGNYFKKYGILNGQGRSSLSFIKKGLGIDFFNENPMDANFNEDNTFSMKFGNWVAQDSFHLKSFYTDWPRCTTPVVYKLTDEVMRTRGVMEDRPYKKYYMGDYTDSASANSESDLSHNMETGARCVPDGFPVIIYQNGKFWGVNSWQLKKHRDNYMLNKKKATNIHLDGYMGTTKGQTTPFWLYNGTIDWTTYCSGFEGIETRNPKNLYCVDGLKYDADTHDAEIIDTTTAETWIAAGQIIPTGEAIDKTLAGYLRTTGKVRASIEELTTYVPDIQTLIDGGSSTADIRAAIEDRFDVDSFIDYILIGNIISDTDCWNNNGQIITWGKLDGSNNLHWSVNVYDKDVAFGCVWNGTSASAATDTKYGSSYVLYKFFWDYYYDELKSRYQELRDKGIFDANHITGLFRNWMDRVGYDNYSKEYKKWNQSPCFRDGSETYTLYPETGGFYGSIERIYLWIKKRIEYMDAASFFDYNA